MESFVNDRRNRLVEKLRNDARTIATQLYRDPLLEIANAVMKRTGVLGVGEEIIERLSGTLKQLQTQLT